MTEFRVIPEPEQLNALVEGRCWELLETYRQETESPSIGYRDIFTVTRKGLVEYLKSNYRFGELWRSEAGPEDGFYVVKRLIGYRCFHQERLLIGIETHVRSKNEAWQVFANYLLKVSGTGLPDSHWDQPPSR